MLLCFSDGQTQGQTGRLTDSMRITDGRTDARWYSGYVVRHWTGMASNGTPLRHTHGQLPHATVRAEQRQTDALLSAGKMLHPCTHTQKNTHTHTCTRTQCSARPLLFSTCLLLAVREPDRRWCLFPQALSSSLFLPSSLMSPSFSSSLLSSLFLCIFVWHLLLKRNATGLEIQPVTDRSGLWSGLHICESVCGESPGMNMTRALCQRGCSSNCSNANDHIWMHCYLAFLSHSFSSSVAHPVGRDSFSKLFQPLNSCWRSVKERQAGKGGVKRG